MEEKITPRQGMFESVVRIWGELLPAELSRHCRIVDISAGSLKVGELAELLEAPSRRLQRQLREGPADSVLSFAPSGDEVETGALLDHSISRGAY